MQQQTRQPSRCWAPWDSMHHGPRTDTYTHGRSRHRRPPEPWYQPRSCSSRPGSRRDAGLHGIRCTTGQELTLIHMDDPDIDAPLSLGTNPVHAAADPAAVEMLGSMGFDAPRAKKALQETNGDVKRAVEWLFNHADGQGLPDDVD